MKNLFFVGLLALLFVSMAAVAQSPFDGTWKWDPSSVQWPEKPDVFLLQNGMFECRSSVPPVNVKADGTDQKVTGDPYRDAVSVKVIDDYNVEETSKKDGKVVVLVKRSVSADGNTLTVNWTYSGNPSGGPQTGNHTDKRVDKAPAGANLISGSWRMEKEDQSAESRTWTFKVNRNELTATTPTGLFYAARLDGTDAPVKGDPGVTSVSVKMLGKDTLEETFKRDGKVIIVEKSTVAADGKTLKLIDDDKLHGTTIKGVAQKQ
ncbi:MAG TPA: hypothetical protein VKF84_13100 [Candidatus Sulfotelmatobacter sp.]|nr:hypothetical protein [Candidatus Sulfotelmatobacter sp.]